MRSMGDPLYVYTPWSEERREKMSKLHKRRLGIPDGHIRLYGIHIPEDEGRRLAKHAQNVARLNGYDAAVEFIKSDKPDWELVEELIAEQMTLKEVADFFKVPVWYLEKETTHLRRINRKRVPSGQKEDW